MVGLTILAALLTPAAIAEAPELGAPAPPIVAETLKHRPLELAGLEGKVVLLQFWASWCHACVAKLPDLKRLYEQHATDGLEIVGISVDEEIKAARRAVAEQQLGWPQICDRKGLASPLAESYGVDGTPRYFVIDREGRLAARTLNMKELERKVVELLAVESAGLTEVPEESP